MKRALLLAAVLPLISMAQAQTPDVEAQREAMVGFLQSELARARETIRKRDEQIKMLENELQALRARLAILEGGGSANPAPSDVSTSPPEGSASIEELESQLKVVRSQIGSANAEVARTVRATVDRKNVQPPDGMTIPPGGSYGTYNGGDDGLILRKQSSVTHQSGTQNWTEQRYYYVPCGPAIARGDFRTDAEKEAAINEAKTALSALRTKERKLMASIEKAKKEAKEAASREKGDKKGNF